MENIIYTDGACSGNGKETATGGFGLLIQNSIISNEDIQINKKCVTKTVQINDKSHTFYVTNIRMEGYAILTALWIYYEILLNNKNYNKDNIIDIVNSSRLKSLSSIKHKYKKDELKKNISIDKPVIINIITDSQFWINVITKWMPSWVNKDELLKKKKTNEERKNPDILLYMYYYFTSLTQNNIKINFIHVRSHQKGEKTEHAAGNEIADLLATNSVKNINSKFILQH